MSLLRKLPLLFALALAPATAYAQVDRAPHAHAHGQHVQRIEPVPAPSSEANPEAEHDEGPAPFKLWGSTILNNKQPPFWAMLFNFALLCLLYWRYGKKPVAEGLKNRKIAIATAIEHAERILREAKQRSKRYRTKLEKVANDAEEAKTGQVSTGRGEAEMLLRIAGEKAARIAREAEFLLEQEKKQTKIDLVRETVEKAASDAEVLLRKSVSAQDQERLAEEFIAELSKEYEKGLTIGGAS